MANPDSTAEVIEAIQAALRADSGMTALVSGRVHDRVPDASPMPLVAIGDILGRLANETYDEDDDENTEAGFELSVTIEVWSKTRGRTEAAQILRAISNRLRSGLTLATKTVVSMQMTDQRINPLEGEQYAYAFQRWQIVTDG